MGLEPTTFCMANARDVRTRSRPFAQSNVFAGSSSARPNASEPERTPNLAILATTPAARRPPVAELFAKKFVAALREPTTQHAVATLAKRSMAATCTPRGTTNMQGEGPPERAFCVS
jgi:hypothetical protein